jgi:uncharacterized cupin superfamily protein
VTTAHERRGAIEAVERIVNRGGEADDVLRQVVDVLSRVYPYGSIRIVEDGVLVQVGPITADDRAFLERVATLVSAYARVGFDTGVPEAPLEDFGSGLAPTGEGWFVVNVRDAEWWTGWCGSDCAFENEMHKVDFPQLGVRLHLVQPDEPSGLYHSESTQEAFLVLSGECRLLVEGEERLLRQWDFFQCAPWTEHIFVGAGDEPCVILMAGARSDDAQGRYPVSELAARYGASVEQETSDSTEALARFELWRRARPSYWGRLPWA